MFKPSAFLPPASILAVLLLYLTPLLHAQSPQLPPGAVQKKIITACTECHDSSIIVQQRLTKAAWGKEVDKMIKWGALVDAQDREAFIEYLSANFPPDKTPEVMPRATTLNRH